MLLGRALLLASAAEPAERMLQRATEKLPADPLAFYYLADAAERRAHFRRRARPYSTTRRSPARIPTRAYAPGSPSALRISPCA